MSTELFSLLDEIEEEKGISKDVILDALSNALVSAYKKNFGAVSDIDVKFEDDGEIKIFTRRTVVEEVEDRELEISLDDARKIRGDYMVGDIVETEDTPASFGRIAAQTARQVVLQRMREAEREKMIEEYSEREHGIVQSIVRKIERRNVMLEVDGGESVLMPNEQVKADRYEVGERYKVFVVEVAETTHGVHLVVSRSHPGLVKCLLELEVPEFTDGLIEFKGIAREPGSRTKIAVSSNQDYIDPVGTCIGPKGIRIQNITDELRGERIDIVRYSSDPRVYIKNALSPAVVADVFEDTERKLFKAIIPQSHFSLAIGREGQNVRLAARLTGKKIELVAVPDEDLANEYGTTIEQLEAEAVFQFDADGGKVYSTEVSDSTSEGTDGTNAIDDIQNEVKEVEQILNGEV